MRYYTRRERRIVHHTNALNGQWFDNVFIAAFVIVDPDGQQAIAKYLGNRDVLGDGSLARFIEDGWTMWRQIEAERR